MYLLGPRSEESFGGPPASYILENEQSFRSDCLFVYVPSGLGIARRRPSKYTYRGIHRSPTARIYAYRYTLVYTYLTATLPYRYRTPSPPASCERSKYARGRDSSSKYCSK